MTSSGLAGRRGWLRRGVMAACFIVAVLVTLRVAHWAAIRYVHSLSPQHAFPEIQLRPGITKSQVLERLGQPESALRHAPEGGQPARETIRYVRGANTLELSFADDVLEGWVETRPAVSSPIRFGRDLDPACCASVSTPAKEPSRQDEDKNEG